MAFKTAEQIEAERGPREARAREAAAADHASRSEKSRKRVVGVLVEMPTEGHANGTRLVRFRAREAGREGAMSAVYFAPDHERHAGMGVPFGAQGLDDRVAALKVGDEISMAGYWGKHRWHDQQGAKRETWEFNAQRFEPGNVSLDGMELAARNRLGDVPEVAPGRSADASVAREAGRPPASPSLSYSSGNVVDDGADVLVNTVNSRLSPSGRGVMGKGVALAFAERFPSIMGDYEAAIRSGELRPGRALLFDLPDGRKWAALATKDDWRDKSREEWVEAGLKELGEKVRAAGLSSVALPPPGCGNGGLDWRRVEPLVHRHVATDGVSVSMYAKPSGSMDPAPRLAAGDTDLHARMTSTARETSDAKARQLAALGGGRPEVAQRPAAREWSRDEVLKAIPDLLRGSGGYQPYAGIGSRETPQDVCDDMTAAARVLESRGFTLRSGFAGGADTAFELGTRREDLREVFAPWKGFGQNPDSPHERTRWDQIRRHEAITGERFVPAKPRLLEGEMARRAEELAAPHHPHWDNLKSGARQLHSRNMGQVYGPTLDVPARFEMAYTVDGKASGGTGQAIRVAQSAGVPVLNMHDPEIRAAVLRELGIARERGLAVEARREDPSVSRSAADGGFDLAVPDVRSRAKRDVAAFCKVADPLGILSNMARAPLEVSGVTFSSSEALYQAMRFPAHPDLQRAIAAEQAYPSKIMAHENKHLTRPDWEKVNTHAMAFAVTVKHDQNARFREELASTEGRDVVELSMKDPFWGARPEGDRLVGRDVLGSILTQLRDGARMDEPPRGSLMFGRDLARFGREAEAGDLPEPSQRASMYFSYGANRRDDFKSETTFEAIKAGERTSTTRYDAWGSQSHWERLKPGQVIRFYEDKEMRGESVDVVALSARRVDLAAFSPQEMADWSRAEGWTERHGRESARRYGTGVQIRYALPDSPEGREALARSRGGAVERPVEAAREVPSQSKVAQRATPAQIAGMSEKARWMNALG